MKKTILLAFFLLQVFLLLGCETLSPREQLYHQYNEWLNQTEQSQYFTASLSFDVDIYETMTSTEVLINDGYETYAAADLDNLYLYESSQAFLDVYEVLESTLFHYSSQYNLRGITTEDEDTDNLLLKYYLGESDFNLNYVYLTEEESITLLEDGSYQAHINMKDMSSEELASFNLLIGSPIPENDIEAIELNYNYSFNDDLSVLTFTITSNRFYDEVSDEISEFVITSKVQPVTSLDIIDFESLGQYLPGGFSTEGTLFELNNDGQTNIYLTVGSLRYYKVYLEVGEYQIYTSQVINSEYDIRILNESLEAVSKDVYYQVSDEGMYFVELSNGNSGITRYTIYIYKIDN